MRNGQMSNETMKELSQMTGMERSLVQISADKVRSMPDTAASLFYSCLFDLDPGLEAWLPDDSSRQVRIMMRMVDLAIETMLHPEKSRETLFALSSSIAAYGVDEHDYRSAQRAWLWMLRQLLDGEFTPEMKQAWTIVIEQLVNDLKAETSTAILAIAAPPSRRGFVSKVRTRF